MKNFVLSVLFASAGVSLAGESVAKEAILPAEVIPQTVDCNDCLKHSGLFLGVEADYFFDAEEVYYNGRVGHEWAGKDGKYTQSLFLEAGWFQDDRSLSELEVIPITLNYEYKRVLYKCLNFYIGAGAGIAFVDSESFEVDKTKGERNRIDDENDTVFIVQAFAGLSYCLTKNVSLYTGVRYLWSDEIDGNSSGIDDWSIGAGLRVKF